MIDLQPCACCGDATVGYVCCTLGDERMFEVWGHWPPTSPASEPA